VYQSPDKTSSLTLPEFKVITDGPYTYFSDSCNKKKWERTLTPWNYGPDNVMYDLNLLLSSQRVVHVGDEYRAEYVPNFPAVKVDIVATVMHRRVVAERESFSYGEGTGWHLYPFHQQNYGYTVNYDRIDSSPPIIVPPQKDVQDVEPSKSGAIRICRVPTAK
jgi:hypothetical protein